MRRSQQKQQQQKFLRVNERIRARQVRLIGHDGGQVGIVSLRDALRIAREQNLDLIEVAPDASPPVCKIMDYGKYRYQQGKREKDSQRRRKSAEVKIVRLSPGTDDHDLVTKQRQTEKFLRRGHKVQFNVRFKGREVTHPEIARDLLYRLYGDLQALATVERPPLIPEGSRQMTMIISPRPDMPPPAPDMDLEEEEDEQDLGGLAEGNGAFAEELAAEEDLGEAMEEAL